MGHRAVMGDELAEVHRGSDCEGFHLLRSVNFMLKTVEGPF